MPPYDPKANRPKLVSVDDAPAPVDALLGPTPDAVSADAGAARSATGRTHLTVVPPDDGAPRVVPDPAPPAASKGFDPKAALAIAVTVAAVVGLMVAARRRGR